eukprot:4736994-Alexandrium_andersonii.AAC.1
MASAIVHAYWSNTWISAAHNSPFPLLPSSPRSTTKCSTALVFVRDPRSSQKTQEGPGGLSAEHSMRW